MSKKDSKNETINGAANDASASNAASNEKEQPMQTSPVQDREQDLINTLQRLQAEFENYKKRTDKEQEEFRKRATEQLLTRLLDIADTFELVIMHGKNTQDKDLLQGVELTFAQISKLMEDYGVTPINPLGQQFDPHTSEALMTTQSDKPSGTVIEVFQKGYSLAGRVIRHARVKVAQ